MTKWPKAVVSHLSTEISQSVTQRHLSSAFLPITRLDESTLLEQKCGSPWSHDGEGCYNLQSYKQGAGYGKNGPFSLTVPGLLWWIHAGLSGLFSCWAQLERTQGRDMMQQGHVPLFDLLLGCCKNLAKSLLNFWASVSLPVKQERCHQLPLQSTPRWTLESTNEELAIITSKFRKKKGSCSLGPNIINK